MLSTVCPKTKGRTSSQPYHGPYKWVLHLHMEKITGNERWFVGSLIWKNSKLRCKVTAKDVQDSGQEINIENFMG